MNNKQYVLRNRFIYALSVCLLCLIFTSCADPDSDSDNSSASISRYTFEAVANSVLSTIVTCSINKTNINCTVPHSTNVTAMVATFKNTGESVTVNSIVQTSGTTVNDFTNPVTYKVIAEDDGTQEYTVTVTVASPSEKSITAFAFKAEANAAQNVDVTGIIDESNRTISLTVPSNTDVTTLVATFTASGASVTVNGAAQTSGTTANDFTDTVTYLVTASDGTT
ncbi:DUF5018 domain-containing protein [bacterium]|nr:DUF5018 domain-containing protein [bacterium]